MKIRPRNRHRSASQRPLLESLESRILLSASTITAALQRYFAAIENQILLNQQKHKPQITGETPTYVLPSHAHPDDASPPGAALIPAQVLGAYGVNQLSFNGAPLDGAGQTIAIIDAYNDPNAYSDLANFSNAFNLPVLQDFSVTGSAPSYFRKVSQTGTTTYPPTDPAGSAGAGDNTWELEESLDIEWAHAMAPAANIILVEATSTSDANLIQGAVNWARNAPGVSVVSMSFSGSEFSSESSLDTYFTTPAGHQGVTFLASTGDDGEPSGYPAYSPNVIAVGGTSLTVSGDSYASETAWSGSGGGISVDEAQPLFQNGTVTQSATKRTAPDVSIDADPNVGGVAIYDSYDFGSDGWIQIGGTSLSAPLWSGLIALTDQLRSLHGAGSLDGATQTLPQLYKLPAADFHDITSGSNGFSAGAGYDLVTGRGSPIANLLVPDLAGVASVSGTVFQDNNANGLFDTTDSPLAGVTVFADDNDNGILDPGTQVTVSSTNVPKAIPDNNTTGITSTLTVAGILTPISDLNITFNITHPDDSNLTAYLIAPDGTQITLFALVGGTGKNFTNTTLDDQAATLISAGAAPFSNTYRPSAGALADFIGRDANGVWKLRIVDSVNRNTGTLNSWSLTITTSPEPSAVTDANGNYSFADLTLGSTHFLRQILPTHYLQDSPIGSAPNAVLLAANTSNINFGDFPTTFTTATDTSSFYLTLDPTHTYLQIYTSNSDAGAPAYQIALSLLPNGAAANLTFNLLGAANTLTIDYTNGSPITGATLSALAAFGSNDTLTLIGQSPSQPFTMTDTQIGPTSAPFIAFQNISNLSLYTMTVNYTGSLSTLNNLYINAGTTFIWN